MGFLTQLLQKMVTGSRRYRANPYSRGLAMLLACVIVFVTTYQLILPALTLDREAAEDMAGIVVESSLAEEKAEDTTEAVPQMAAQAAVQMAAGDTAGQKPGDETDDADLAAGVTEPSGNAADEFDEDLLDFKDEEALSFFDPEDIYEEEEDLLPDWSEEVEDEQEEDRDSLKVTPVGISGTKVLRLPGASYKVRVRYEETAGIPKDAAFVISPVEEVPEFYAREALQTVNDSYTEDITRKLSLVGLFDLTIYVDGEVLEPAGEVQVEVLFDEDMPEDEQIFAVHFPGTGQQSSAEAESGGLIEDEDSFEQGSGLTYEDLEAAQLPQIEADLLPTRTEGEWASFTVEGLSYFALVSYTGEVQTKQTVISAAGKTYEITATYGEDAQIPEDAVLAVTEIMDASALYETYVTKVENALGMDEGTAEYIRLFDIKIVDQDNPGIHYQPAQGSFVDVCIHLADADEASALSVVHFASVNARGDVVDAEVDGQRVAFEAEGFSVYAITDDGGAIITPRAIYHFLTREGANQDAAVETQIIKNNETLREVPVSVGETEAFIGWYIWENNRYGEKVEFDTPIAVAFADSERSLSSAQVILISDNIDVYLRPRYSDLFASVRFLRADTSTIEANAQTILNTVKVGIEEGQSSVTYILPDKEIQYAETAEQSYEFVGWSTQPPAQVGGAYQYYSPSDGRTTVTELSLNNNDTVNLYPVFKQAHWITFKSAPTGSGATYYSPAWVENGQTAESKKPLDDPGWNGYRFLYWTTTPTFDETTGTMIVFDEGREPEPFDFSQELTEDITLYGYWESGITTYTVVTWKQVVTDDKDASPQNRHYEFAGQEVREGKVGDIVNLTDADITQAFTGFHHKTEQDTEGDRHVDSSNVTVASGGTTVLNVYYDRDLMTMQFYSDGSGTGPTDGYNDEVWTKESPYVMTYTGLYGQSLQQNGYTWPAGTWTYYQNPSDVSDTSGMSYLGQFVFPNKEIGPYFRAYNTGASTRSIDFFLQNPDGSYPNVRTDYGVVSSSGQFNFTDKYDGFTVVQYRRYRVGSNGRITYYNANGTAVTGTNAESAWANANVGDSTALAVYLTNNNAADYDGWYFTYNGNSYSYAGDRYEYYWGYGWYPTNSTTGDLYTINYTDIGRQRIYKCLYTNLEIRYARKPYNIMFLDPTDNTPIAATMENGSTSTAASVLYGADVTPYYPSSGFVPQSKTAGVVFNGRWYSDSAQTIQVFFHDKDQEALTDAEEALLWYYVDASGEKYYTGYVPTEEQIAGSTDRTYGRDQVTVITEMPMHDLPVYPGWAKEWYWIKIDPNGGELPDGASTWFWETYGGDKVQKYDVTRKYILDDSGSCYYHYDEFNTADPNGTQPGTRLAYYTTDSSAASDVTKRYRPATSAEEYIFVGWYQVNSDDSLTPYNFDSEITGNLTLRAIWAQTGDYKVRYSLDHAVDINGNPLTNSTVTGTVPVDTYHYAENANAMVKSGDDPVAQLSDGTTKIFLGWMVSGGNDVLKAGDLFVIDPAMAVDADSEDGIDLKDTLILYPVFGDEQPETSTSDRTALILDMNGGTTALTTIDGTYTVNARKTQIAYVKQQVNAAIVLPPQKTGTADNFTKSNSEFLGWAFSPNAKTPEFTPGQTIGIDNLTGQGYSGDDVNTLYAVWHQNQIQIKVLKIDGTSENQNRIVLADAQFTLKESGSQTGDTYTSNAEGWLEQGGSTSITLFTPEEVNGASVYELTETGAPAGYLLPAGSEAVISVHVDYDGNVTYVQPGRFNGALQTAQKDADGIYKLEISNEPEPIPVTLKKVGVDNQDKEAAETPLSGAAFTLYEANGTNIVLIGEEEQKNISSDAEGIFFHGQLKPGRYYLEETDTPDGYYSPLGRFEITVSKDAARTQVRGTWTSGDVSGTQGTVTGNAADGYVITVRNVTGVALPAAGGYGTRIFTIPGSILMAGAGVLLWRRRRLIYSKRAL